MAFFAFLYTLVVCFKSMLEHTFVTPTVTPTVTANQNRLIFSNRTAYLNYENNTTHPLYFHLVNIFGIFFKLGLNAFFRTFKPANSR